MKNTCTCTIDVQIESKFMPFSEIETGEHFVKLQGNTAPCRVPIYRRISEDMSIDVGEALASDLGAEKILSLISRAGKICRFCPDALVQKVVLRESLGQK